MPRIGWRTITVGIIVLAFIWAMAFAGERSEGASPASAALNASVGFVLVVAGTAVFIGLIGWASRDGSRLDREEMRARLRNLDGQEDDMIARLSTHPRVNDLIMISVFRIRDEKADVLQKMGRHEEARKLRADTAMRRESNR